MSRLLAAAAILLSLVAAPAFACPWEKSVSTGTAPSTVASQPADDQGTPPPVTPADQKSG